MMANQFAAFAMLRGRSLYAAEFDPVIHVPNGSFSTDFRGASGLVSSASRPRADIPQLPRL